jgi:hypothetical protein
MKKYCAWILYIGAAALGGAQVPDREASLTKVDAPQVTERGAHHRKWAYVTSSIGLDGRTMLKTNRYTEIGTGLHYRRDGEWVESKAVIDIVQGGALASQGPHQVGFAANINTPGAINLLTPDGQRLRSHVLGLAYTDARTGQSVLIAQVQDSVGMLVSDNQIIYPNAFDDANAVKADIRYTYTTAGFEQDIILRADPPGPELFGLDPATTRLEVFTEFVEAPQPTVIESTVLERSSPEQRGKMVWPDFVNQTLGFGAMRMDVGAAFPIENSLDLDQSIPTGKTWELREGRTFLIEAVLYPAIKPEIEKLPPNPPGRRAVRTFPKAGSNRSFPPPPVQARRGDKVTRMAATALPEKGYVIDYSIVASTLTNFVFAADTTYFVKPSPNTYLYGTTVIEGGTVIKFTNGNAQLRMMNNVDCRTSPYRPAIYTSVHDNTVGDIIGGSTGNPTGYCGYMVYLGSGITVVSNYFNLHDLRVRHAARAFYGTAQINADISNCQVEHVQYAFKNNTAVWNLRNILVYNARYAFDGAAPLTNNAEHITFHSVSNFMISGLSPVNLTNSLLIGVTNLVSYTGTGVATNLSDVGIFQTVGAGAHYLATNSPYRDAGTTNISPLLQADLRKRTTYPPTLIGGSITADTTLNVTAMRDTDLPDLGYHYDPLDYAANRLWISNATLTVTEGVAIAGYATNSNEYLAVLAENGSLICEGSASRPNHLVAFYNVQEAANTNWQRLPYFLLTPWWSATPGPLRCRFTEFSSVAGGPYYFQNWDSAAPTASFTDCQFYGNGIYAASYPTDGARLTFTNNLFHRVNSLIWADDVFFYNNTFYNGALDFLYGGNGAVHDNAFDSTSISQYFDVTNSHNAYTTNCARITPTGTNDVLVNSISWQTGTLGRFYLTNNTALMNAGSRNATNAGLYHYTMLTNNVKETDTVVDIGFHYVATDAYGVPLDYDGDGLADYWEDWNGNGSYDSGSGESDWQTYNSPNGLSGSPSLKVFTPLK